jgi:hypothetical protein
LHRAAAAGATIADRIEPVQHRIFKKRMMDVPTFVFCRENINCLLLTDPPGALGMMFRYETGKRFADNETHIQWLARIGA